MKPSLKLPLGGASESTESSSHITKRNSCPQEKSSPFGGAGAQAPERVLQYDLYRRIPK